MYHGQMDPDMWTILLISQHRFDCYLWVIDITEVGIIIMVPTLILILSFGVQCGCSYIAIILLLLCVFNDKHYEQHVCILGALGENFFNPTELHSRIRFCSD